MTPTPEETISVQIGDGRMVAEMRILPGLLASEVTPEVCQAIIQEAEISITAKVMKAVQRLVDAYAENPTEVISGEIARGTPVESGEDGQLQWCEAMDPNAEPATRIEEVDDDEAVDYYATTNYVTVVPDQEIARLIPPTQGSDGTTVDGRVLAAPAGKAFNLRNDDSVRIESDGRILAQRAGLVSFEADRLCVLDLLEIKGNVDFSTGNIDFDGRVVVHKGVRDRFLVHCTGDLVVEGLIEAATIEAGKNAIFRRGMAAREKGTVRIGGTLQARYLDDVRGTIARDLAVEREIVKCHLSVGGTLTLERGAIVGGDTCVGGLVKVEALGSEGGVQTIVRLGKIADLSQALVQISQLLAQLNERLEKSQEDLGRLNARGGKLRPSQREQLTEMQYEISTCIRHINTLTELESRVDQTLEEFAVADLEVVKRIHRGVILLIGDQQARIRTSLVGPLRIHVNERGEPVVTDMAQKTTQSLSNIAEMDDDQLPVRHDVAA